MKKVKDFNDIDIRDSEEGTKLLFPDNTKYLITYKSTDKINSYSLIQIQLQRILKNGKMGNSGAWLKFRTHL